MKNTKQQKHADSKNVNKTPGTLFATKHNATEQIQGNTKEYTGIQGNTKEYQGIQRNIGGAQRNTTENKGMQPYKGI